MKIVRPVSVTDAILTSNIAEDDGPAHSLLATYALGDVVVEDHQAYESLIADNTGHALTEAAYWLSLGATNRWRMFDQSVGTVTEGDSGIDVTIAASGRVDGLALLNLDAETVQVVMTSDDYGEQYNETHSLLSDSGIQSWYAYFSEEIEYATELVLTDLPLTSNVEVQVVISSDAGPVSAGTMVLGQTRFLGDSVYGASGGILDFSRKTTDEFGNTTLTERAYAKRNSFKLVVESGAADSVYAILALYRATPVVWVGTDTFRLTWIYGWVRDWNVALVTPSHSHVNLEIEGLT